MTQHQIILDILKNHPEGIHPSTLAFEAKITQYNARIKELRDKFGCACKFGDEDSCTAREHIINRDMGDGTTKFFYKDTTMEIYRRNAILERQRKENLSKDYKFDEGLF